MKTQSIKAEKLLTEDMAEAAFYLKTGLALAEVRVNYNTRRGRMQVRMEFQGRDCQELKKRWEAREAETWAGVEGVRELVKALSKLAGGAS